jgi:hypothetical protein
MESKPISIACVPCSGICPIPNSIIREGLPKTSNNTFGKAWLRIQPIYEIKNFTSILERITGYSALVRIQFRTCDSKTQVAYSAKLRSLFTDMSLRILEIYQPLIGNPAAIFTRVQNANLSLVPTVTDIYQQPIPIVQMCSIVNQSISHIPYSQPNHSEHCVRPTPLQISLLPTVGWTVRTKHWNSCWGSGSKNQV